MTPSGFQTAVRSLCLPNESKTTSLNTTLSAPWKPHHWYHCQKQHPPGPESQLSCKISSPNVRCQCSVRLLPVRKPAKSYRSALLWWNETECKNPEQAVRQHPPPHLHRPFISVTPDKTTSEPHFLTSAKSYHRAYSLASVKLLWAHQNRTRREVNVCLLSSYHRRRKSPKLSTIYWTSWWVQMLHAAAKVPRFYYLYQQIQMMWKQREQDIFKTKQAG